MEQISIYQVIGFTTDPVFEQLSGLPQNNSITIDGIVVFKNVDGWYKISHNEIIEHFETIQDCYDVVTHLICTFNRGFFYPHVHLGYS